MSCSFNSEWLLYNELNGNAADNPNSNAGIPVYLRQYTVFSNRIKTFLF